MNQVVFFDGVCNLCNGTVQFLIKHDKKNVLKFSSLQSEYGQKMLQENQMNATNFESILYLKNGRLLDKSSAVLEILYDLGGFWKGLIVFKIVPKFLRDWVYKVFSVNRYKWFGKKESCWLPTPELKEKFI